MWFTKNQFMHSRVYTWIKVREYTSLPLSCLEKFLLTTQSHSYDFMCICSMPVKDTFFVSHFTERNNSYVERFKIWTAHSSFSYWRAFSVTMLGIVLGAAAAWESGTEKVSFWSHMGKNHAPYYFASIDQCFPTFLQDSSYLI